MKDSIIVKRYADAFMAYMKEGPGEEKAYKDLKNLRNMIRDNPQFEEVLHSPGISYAEKCSFIDSLLEKGFSPQLRHFLKLLLEKGRIEKILDIAEYIRITYSHGREVEAVLKTTFPLDLELMRMIGKKLEQKFDKKFKLFVDLDDTLLGGIQIIFANTIIDGSVKRQLLDLKEKLSNLRVG